jgi:hypothetical protein
LTAVTIDIIYGNFRGGILVEAEFEVTARNFCYLRVMRREDHEPDCAMILDAYLHTASPLLEAVKSGKMDPVAGSMLFGAESLARANRHIEIIGEMSIDVVCELVEVVGVRGFPFDSD